MIPITVPNGRCNIGGGDVLTIHEHQAIKGSYRLCRPDAPDRDTKGPQLDG
jgi:hypothetical protein